MTKSIIIKNVDKFGWETKIKYRKSMNDLVITKKNNEIIKINGSNENNDKFIYVNLDLIKELMKEIEKTEGTKYE